MTTRAAQKIKLPSSRVNISCENARSQILTLDFNSFSISDCTPSCLIFLIYLMISCLTSMIIIYCVNFFDLSIYIPVYNNFVPRVAFQINILAAVLPLLPFLCCPGDNIVHPKVMKILCILAQANFPLNASVCRLPSFIMHVSQKKLFIDTLYSQQPNCQSHYTNFPLSPSVQKLTDGFSFPNAMTTNFTEFLKMYSIDNIAATRLIYYYCWVKVASSQGRGGVR